MFLEKARFLFRTHIPGISLCLRSFFAALVRALYFFKGSIPGKSMTLQDVVISKKMSESWGHLLRHEASFWGRKRKGSRSTFGVGDRLVKTPKLAKNLPHVGWLSEVFSIQI